MYHEVIVMEIKKKYALAMSREGEIIRIAKKHGMAPGQKIFILEEDIWTQTEPSSSGSRHLWYTMAAAAAIFLLFITTFAMTHMQNRAYAEVSVDGNRSIQLSVNKKNIIVDARTKDEDLEKDLHQNLKGKELNALPDYLVQENITSSGAVVGYAPVHQKEEKQMDRLQRTLERMMGTSDILYLRGTNEDLLAAKNSGKSLGTYLLSRSLQENLDGDNLLPVQPGQSEEDFIDFLKKQSGLLEDEDLSSAMEQIKEKITEKQNTETKKQKKENKKNKDEVNAEDQEDAEEDEKTSVKQKETDNDRDEDESEEEPEEEKVSPSQNHSSGKPSSKPKPAPQKKEDNDKDDPEPEEEKESPSDEEQELSDDQDDD